MEMSYISGLMRTFNGLKIEKLELHNEIEYYLIREPSEKNEFQDNKYYFKKIGIILISYIDDNNHKVYELYTLFEEFIDVFSDSFTNNDESLSPPYLLAKDIHHLLNEYCLEGTIIELIKKEDIFNK